MKLRKLGETAVREVLEPGRPAVVLAGRPYNLHDTALNMNIQRKIVQRYGVPVIPMDILPITGIDIAPVHPHMFWNYGRKIIQAAMFIRNYANAHLIFISNFKCGPDSYIRHYIEDACGEPFLFLQMDSHANDAGILTRVEAFLESKQMIGRTAE